jgi:hypothetical protein
LLDNYIANYVKKEEPKNCRRGGELSLQGYGAMKNVFQQFLEWAMGEQINLIFIAHLTEEKDGDNVKYIPKVTGGSYDILRQTMDLIGFIESNLNKRVIDFAPRDRHIGKDCAEIGMVELPDYRKSEFRTFMDDIIKKTLDRMNSLADNQAAILQKILDFEVRLTQLNPDKCNALIESLRKENDKALQAQMFAMLRSYAERSGMRYDTKLKAFANVQDTSLIA